MRMYPQEFPSGRRKKPKRQAERRVYEALANSNRRGFVYYEWRKDYQRIELDFAVWIADLGRIALQVKGGHYLLIDGEWFLETREGVKIIRSCPLDETWLAMLDLHDDIEERAQTTYNPFVIPVLSFPDMAPDEAIEKLARRKGVYLVWGTDRLMDDLAEIVESRGVSDTLPMDRIGREVWAISDGLIRLDGWAEDGASTVAAPIVPDSLPGGAATLRLMVNGKPVLVIRGETLSVKIVRRTSPRGDPLM